MNDLTSLSILFEKLAGDVVPFRNKHTHQTEEEFKDAVEKTPLDQRVQTLCDDVIDTVELTATNLYIELEDEAYLHLDNYLKNWVREWIL